MSKCFFSGTDRSVCTCDACNTRRPSVHVLDFTCQQHGDYTVKVQCPTCEHERQFCSECGKRLLGSNECRCKNPSTKPYTLAAFAEWAKNLAHLNPKFVDAFVERHKDGWMMHGRDDAQGAWAVEMTAVEWMDQWAKFWSLPPEQR